jgi:hypothetical protein
VNKIEILKVNYKRYISTPWSDVAAAQRVIFCVYDKEDERKVRLSLEAFKLITIEAGHDWKKYDLTDSFARWLIHQRYAEKYFQKPNFLSPLLKNYLKFILDDFETSLKDSLEGENTVVAVVGVGSLFGFLKARDVVEGMAPLIKGRLLIFFPGSFGQNNYRLLDAYDGWNYLAVPITVDEDF